MKGVIFMSDKTLKIIKVVSIVVSGAASMFASYVATKQVEKAVPGEIGKVMSDMKLIKKG